MQLSAQDLRFLDNSRRGASRPFPRRFCQSNAQVDFGALFGFQGKRNVSAIVMTRLRAWQDTDADTALQAVRTLVGKNQCAVVPRGRLSFPNLRGMKTADLKDILEIRCKDEG
jgi:hypothetical protein